MNQNKWQFGRFYGFVVVALLSGYLSADEVGSFRDADRFQPQYKSDLANPPNVVLILLDDVGFGDTSTFGGLVNTETLDRLAQQGLRYNNFHTAGLCGPTRAALLSGRNPHRIGFGTSVNTDKNSAFPGYDGVWKKNAATIAAVLREKGYGTAAFGKWHNTPAREMPPDGPFERWPTGLGFEYFWGFHGGDTDQWNPQVYRNTVRVPNPESPATHFSTRMTDEAIRWLSDHRRQFPGRPYFLYFAMGAAHAPHQAPREWIERYRGKFDQGWDALREQIYRRQKALGVIPEEAVLTPRPEALPAWDSLSAAQRRLYARQMEIYAGFLSHADHEVGRLMDAVQRGPGGGNTIVVYVVGDNGASGEGGLGGSDNFPLSYIGGESASQAIDSQLAHIEELGGPAYRNHYMAAWSWMGATPFQWMKQVASHLGGIRNPLVIAWPDRIKDKGGIRSQFGYVTDIAATLYEAIGIRPPSVVAGAEQLSLDGISLLYTFDNPSAISRRQKQYFEVGGNRAIYAEGWMASSRHSIPWIIRRNDDFDGDRWELYDLTEDFSQANDLSAEYPDKLQRLKNLFEQEAAINHVYPLNDGLPDVAEHYRSRKMENEPQ